MNTNKISPLIKWRKDFNRQYKQYDSEGIIPADVDKDFLFLIFLDGVKSKSETVISDMKETIGAELESV